MSRPPSAEALLEDGIDITTFGEQLLEVLLKTVPTEQAFFYHFLTGQMTLTTNHLRGYPITPQDFIERAVAFKPPLSPATILPHGSGTYRAGEIMQWHRDEIAQWSENLRLVASVGAAWGITYLFMDQEVLLAVAGVSRPIDQGNFSQAEFETLRRLFPVAAAGLTKACEVTRERLLGREVAAALEHHPNCLFAFSDDRQLMYANYAGRLLMQNEKPGVSDLPMASRSTVVAALQEAFDGSNVTHPAIATIRRRKLKRWGPENQSCTLFVVNARSETAQPLSPRQRNILEHVIASQDLNTIATELHISLSTLRTHLRNIYRRLGVSGLDEAIALYCSNNPHAQ